MTLTPSGPKRLLFILVSILSPFVFLTLLEMLFRLCGYGYNYSLFIEDKSHPGFIYMNPDISKKYFSIQENATKGIYEPFEIKKQSQTYRIFVLGESSALGFPYFQSGSFSRMLLYKLERTFPDKKIEIINLSLTAINSYTILDFAKQVIDYSPDAILMYVGHNEYYGAMGVCSTSGLNANTEVVRTILFFRNYRLFQFVSNIFYEIKKKDPGLTDLSKTLMERMAKGQLLETGSEKYKSGIVQFDKNLTSIFETFNKKHLPVYCANLVSNLKDQKPFVSNDFPKSANWNQYYSLGCKYDSLSNTELAFSYFYKANKLDSTIAICNYKLALTAYKCGKYEFAKRQFLCAKENDMLKFRAPEKINSVISKRSRQFSNVRYVDVVKYFKSFSPDSIIGKELITEHLHPNLKGYYIISQAFYDAMKQNSVISNDWPNMVNGQLFSEMPITKLDSLYGAYQVKLLREQWPFNEPRIRRDTSHLIFEEKVAGGLAVKTIERKQAYEAVFNYYLKNQRFRDALHLLEGQIPDLQDNKINSYKMANSLAEKLNDHDLAVFYALKGFQITQSFEFAKPLFINYLKEDLPEKALPYINFAMNNNPEQVNFEPLKNLVEEIIDLKRKLDKDLQHIEISNNIASLYFKIGDYSAAIKYVNKTLSVKKDNKEAKSLQDKINLANSGLN